MTVVRLRAHAKVNLGLAVLGRRDDGYHEVQTLLARVGLHDDVELRPRPSGVRIHVGDAPLPTDARNLAVRAATAHPGGRRGLDIRLRKRIPIAAGLGGGSSDAAAVLRGLEELEPEAGRIERIAPTLGSDVPFFVADLPAALATGRGERLQPVEVPSLHLVLLDPGVPVAASEAYAALRSFGPELDVPAVMSALRSGDAAGLRNDLQTGVAAAHPQVELALEALRSAGLVAATMSGSGSTCYALAADAEQAQRAAGALARSYPAWRVLVTHTA